ncbi:MAG: glutamate synthase [Sulfobacillus acidophilus]|uniref:Glutamate synthase n=1 Tax=Sulfobacillus acidophilus TaxID=53633 RepID=A0A2T2WM61_9FIRM|nr:MAG: glutamate synthase [Sulfobacillus acidophilus]
MGKITGFLEYARQTAPERTPLLRIADFQEFSALPSPEELATQAGRCMDCGVPYCQSGLMLHGMTAGCPTHNLIPEWNDLVYRGAWEEALGRLLKTASFPEFTGRVCPAPCEGSCTVALNAQAVTIKQIERAIIERGFEAGWIKPQPPVKRTDKKVAIIGSGPSGLAAAKQLNAAGHHVTVFERDDRPGGLLMYGIPNMKLDKRIVERRIALMQAEGIEFVCNAEVGANYPAEQIRQHFDAVVLCIGATKPRDLPIPGRNLANIHFAMDFLRENTRQLLGGRAVPAPISAHDRDVVVIGGGDTGTDCVATAIRQKCRSLVQLEILEQSPSVRAPDNPWPEYPRVYKLDYAHEEAEQLWGHDPRDYAVTAKSFVGNAKGEVAAVNVVQVEWTVGPDGRMRPVEVPGTERALPAQLVLLAMGYLGPEDQLLDQWSIARDGRSNTQASPDSYATSIDGIFAAGDARRGQSLVVWAIQEGRAAARECDRYLMGTTDLP